MNAAEFSQTIHDLNNLLQKIIFRSDELQSQLDPGHSAALEARKLHEELQRAVAQARMLAMQSSIGNFGAGPETIPGASKVPPSPTPRTTLLYVDDKPERLELLKTVLENCGYDVITADNGLDGLRIFLSHKIRLVILDYYMPSMNGGAVALEMHSLRPDVPIIIFSGALTLPDLVMSVIDGFISTSEEPEVLLAKISELVRQPRSMAS